MIRRDTLTEYARGSLWVMPAFAVVAALATGALLSQVTVGVHSPLAFQGTPDDARNLLIAIAGTMVTVIALLLGLTVEQYGHGGGLVCGLDGGWPWWGGFCWRVACGPLPPRPCGGPR